MAAELLTPVDYLSGIPLPIVPKELLPVDNPNVANLHHAWHPASDPRLLTPSGLALRHSRVQLVRAADHNMGDKDRGKLTYHDWFTGPQLPDDETEQFKMIVLSCAGYVPDEGIELHGDEPIRVRLNAQQRRILRAPAIPASFDVKQLQRLTKRAACAFDSQDSLEISRVDYIQQVLDDAVARNEAQAGFHFRHVIYRYEPVRDFLRSYVLGSSLTLIPTHESRIDQFLHTTDSVKKQKLGGWLLTQATGRGAQVVADTYTELYRSGNLHSRMPSEARDLVLRKLGSEGQQTELTDKLESVLRAGVGLDVLQAA